MAYQMAIIGMGGMAGWHYKNVCKSIPGIKIIGAYDIRDEANAAIDKLGLKKYKNPQEIYEDAAIDLVLIATPNDVHKNYSIECMQAGKHVICEKPVTLNAAELTEVIKAAEKTGKLFTVHHNRRWDSDYLTIRKILNEGLLHNPFVIESRVQGSRQEVFGWRAYELNGGGMVLDWGIHLLDQMMDLIPEKVISVYAHLHSLVTREVDDNFTAMLRFANGITALINISMNCFILQPRWHMCCQDGTAVIENWELDGKIVKLADPTALDWTDDIIYTAAGPTRSMLPRPVDTTTEIKLPKVKGDWTQYYKNIVEVLDGKAEPIVTQPQLMRVMKVVDAIFESSKTGAAVVTAI